MHDRTDKLIISAFVCPECKIGLEIQADGWLCRKCSRLWTVRGGIPDFLKEEVPYWGELSAREMEALNLDARQRGWKQSLSERVSQDLYSFICDEKRISWRYLVASDTKGKILDIGSGWGTLAFSLAGRGAEVFALEQVKERLEFISIRKEQEQMHNVIAVRASALQLPFPDAHFDVVVLNGVLEWLGLSDQSRPADQVQKACLKEINRVLKPGGSLYIGIENRFAFVYFLGIKDPHSGLRFTTLMPRGMARLKSRIIKKSDYLTYLYSLAGYRRLLLQSGFKTINFYAPVPGYRNPRYLVPLEKRRDLRFFVEHILGPRILCSGRFVACAYSVCHMLLQLPFAARLAKYFIPDYSIIAVK